MIVQIHGKDAIGFATLTFNGRAPTPAQAQHAFRRFRRNFLDRFRPHWVAVLERGDRGRLHYHVITGLPFPATAQATWSGTGTKARLITCSTRLRVEWKLWRHHAKEAGMGAVHGPLPIRRSVEAVSEYLTAYISKALARRTNADKHIKLVLYGRTTRRQTTRTASNSPIAAARREKFAQWTLYLFGPQATGKEWRDAYGRHWHCLLELLPDKPAPPMLLEAVWADGRGKVASSAGKPLLVAPRLKTEACSPQSGQLISTSAASGSGLVAYGPPQLDMDIE